MNDIAKLANALSDRDAEALGELISGYNQRAQFGWPESIDGRPLDGVAPIDCGGCNTSDHSYRFTKLANIGLAEHRKRGWPWGKSPSRRYRGSKVYRPTPLGIAVHAYLRSNKIRK